MLRFFAFLIGATAVTLGVLWYFDILDVSATGVAPANNRKSSSGELSRVETPLDFGHEPAAERPPVATRKGLRDPLVLYGLTVNLRDTEDVSFRVDGKLSVINVKEGDVIPRGFQLGVLDVQLIDAEVRVKESAVEMTKLAIELAGKKREVAQAIVDSDVKAGPAVAEQQARINRLTLEQAISEEKKAKEDKLITEAELTQKRTLRAFHEVKSGIAGRVDRVLKKPNESVKAGETVFRIVSLDALHLDGAFEAHRVQNLKVGDKVVVEPEQLAGWEGELSGHTGAVNGLAVTADGRYLISCGDDRTVRLWDVAAGDEVARMKYDGPAVEVYAVAADPTRRIEPGTSGSYFFVAAGADGWLRTWTISINEAGEITQQVGVPGKEAHRGGIRAVAVSPDGKWIASGGEDRNVVIWKVGGDGPAYRVRKELDPAAAAHRGTVTCLHFTRDGHLISVAADKTVCKWKLGEKQAEWVWEETGRTGDVAQLGLSPDCQRMLLEVDEELRIVDAETRATLDVLRNRRQGSFATLALFSPTTRYILTATAAGRVQLWTLPTPEEFDAVHKGEARLRLPRPHEIRRLVVPDVSGIRCAVFDPREQALYTAGADKVIRVWHLPDPKERLEPLEAAIIDIGENVASGTGLVRIRAAMTNPQNKDRRLKPGDLVNLTPVPKGLPE